MRSQQSSGDKLLIFCASKFDKYTALAVFPRTSIDGLGCDKLASRFKFSASSHISRARHISGLQKSPMAGPAHPFQVQRYKLLRHQETLLVAVEFDYAAASTHAFSSQMVSFTGHHAYGVTTHKTRHYLHLLAALRLMPKHDDSGCCFSQLGTCPFKTPEPLPVITRTQRQPCELPIL